MNIIGNDGNILLFLYSLNKYTKSAILRVEILQNVGKGTGRYPRVDNEAIDLSRSSLFLSANRQRQLIVPILGVDRKRCFSTSTDTDEAVADMVGRWNDGVCWFHFILLTVARIGRGTLFWLRKLL